MTPAECSELHEQIMEKSSVFNSAKAKSAEAHNRAQEVKNRVEGLRARRTEEEGALEEHPHDQYTDNIKTKLHETKAAIAAATEELESLQSAASDARSHASEIEERLNELRSQFSSNCK
jgi:chromosome segregation ATPase